MPFKNYVAEINLGQGGLNGSHNQSRVDPTELTLATNITYENDIIAKEGGAVRYNTVAVPTAGLLLGGVDFFPVTGTQVMVVYTSGGYLLKDEGAGTFAITLKSGLLQTATPVFVQGGQEALANPKKIFTFNGYDAVQVLSGNGVVTTALATPPADWSGTQQPNCGVIHENRLWACLGHRVYFSKTSSHEDFTAGSGPADGGSLAVFPGIGDQIKQIVSFKGVLIVYKEPRGIFLIDTSSTDITAWKVSQLNASIGVASSQSVVQIDDDIIFMDSTGNLQLQSGIDNFNITGSNLSQLKQMGVFVEDFINRSLLSHVKAVFYPAKREVHFAVPQLTSTYNTARLVLDLNHPDVPRFRWSTRDVCEAIWLRRDSTGVQRPVVGDDVGGVWLLDQSVRSKDGAAYLAEFQTPLLNFAFLDPSLAHRQKLACELEIVAEPREGITLLVDVYWDNMFRHTINFSLNPQGVALGTFVLGVDALGSAGIMSIRRRKMLGSGRMLSLRFYNNEVNGDFAISHCYIRFKVGNERISHA